MILVVGLVGVFSGIANGQTYENDDEAYKIKDYFKVFEIIGRRNLKIIFNQNHNHFLKYLNNFLLQSVLLI